MNRNRTPMLLLFTVVIFALLIFGAQLQVPAVMAFPTLASFNSATPTANTCAVSGCHTGTTSATGATITFPAGTTGYTPGGPAIPLTVTVPGTSFSTWGFQLAARMASNAATQAGNFNAGDIGVTQGSGSSSTFTFNWTPPAAGTTDTVNFYLTGVNTAQEKTSNLFSTGMSALKPAVAAVADFGLAASPTSLSFAQGASGSSTVTVSPKNGFTGNVALSASGLPSGVTASFSPASAITTSTLTLTASSTAATGTSTVTITGTSGALTHTTTVSLTVSAAAPAPNFSLSASPTSLTVAQGASGSSTITVTPSGGFTGTPTLSASGMPSGVTASIASGKLTLTASSTAATGTSTVTITGTSGALTHTTTVSLTVSAAAPAPNFSLSASPSSLTVAQGASGSSTITTTALNGFTGSAALSASGMPSGVTASFASTTLTLTASSTAATGTSTVTITGTSGMLSHSTTLSLTVSGTTSANTLTVSPTSLTFNYQIGGSAPTSRTVSIASTGGSTSYTATETDPWLSITPTSGTSTPGSIHASVSPSGMAAGSYGAQINITTPGGKSATVTVSLIITSGSGNCSEGCGGTPGGMYARPYVSDWQSGAYSAAWVNNLGATPNSSTDQRNRGLVLEKAASAPADGVAGATIQNVTGMNLTELGFYFRAAISCSSNTVQFLVVTTDKVPHTVGGCTSNTTTPLSPAPTGWTHLQFDPAKATPPITSQVQSISVVLGVGSTSTGSFAVIDNIEVNGVLVGKGTSTTSTSTSTSRDD